MVFQRGPYRYQANMWTINLSAPHSSCYFAQPVQCCTHPPSSYAKKFIDHYQMKHKRKNKRKPEAKTTVKSQRDPTIPHALFISTVITISFPLSFLWYIKRPSSYVPCELLRERLHGQIWSGTTERRIIPLLFFLA